MSLHFEVSDEVQQRLAREKRVSTISSLIIAVLAIIMVALVLGFFLLPSLKNDEVQIVTYTSNVTDEKESETEKVKTSIQRKPAAPSNSPVKTISAMTVSPTSIPTVDDMEPIESLEFGNGDDFGTGWGAGNGDGFGGGGKQTAFGRTGGGGLEGKFYDLKQDRSKKPNSNNRYFESNPRIMAKLKHMMKAYKDLEEKRFSKSALRDYYAAENALSYSFLVMPCSTKADVGPESFGVEKEVEPSGWVVVYEGHVNPSKPGEYQFVGLFDDVLLVYVDGKLVLDGSFFSYSSLPQPEKKGAVMRNDKPLIEGKWVKLIEGSKVKIVVGESPGGQMGGGLFIREKGKKYKQAEGGDILPPFTTAALTSEDTRKLKSIQKMGLKGDFPIELKDVPVFHPK
ncbi:MAG: hypothetical protein ACSHX7_12540 [Luteolibacter sp.]